MRMMKILLILLALLTIALVFGVKNIITIPVTAILLDDPSGYYTSMRTEENIEGTFAEANRIWAAAGIVFYLEKVERKMVGFETVPNTLNGNASELLGITDEGVTVVFAQSLNNINGYTIPNSTTILLADDSRQSLGRVLAHELGHVLGLTHTTDHDLLMTQGRNGERLTEEEIGTVKNRVIAIRK